MFFDLIDDFPEKRKKEDRKDKQHDKKRHCVDCSGLFVNPVDRRKNKPDNKCNKRHCHEDCFCRNDRCICQHKHHHDDWFSMNHKCGCHKDMKHDCKCNEKHHKCRCQDHNHHEDWNEMKHSCKCFNKHDEWFPLSHKCGCHKDMRHDCKCHEEHNKCECHDSHHHNDWHDLFQHHRSIYQRNHHEHWHDKEQEHNCKCHDKHHHDDDFFKNSCRKCHHMNHHCRCHQKKHCFDCHDHVKVNLNALRNELNMKLMKNIHRHLEIVTAGGFRIGGKMNKVGIDYLDIKNNDHIITVLKDKIDHFIWGKKN